MCHVGSGSSASRLSTYRAEVERVLAAADQIRYALGRDRGEAARIALARAETVLDGDTDGAARALEVGSG